MRQFPQIVLIQKSEELIRVLQEINQKQIKEQQQIERITELEFESELTPEYKSGEFVIENYKDA